MPAPGLRPHDLVWADRLTLPATVPDWVAAAHMGDAPLVVRRAPRLPPDLVPVGLRGQARNERLAAHVALGAVHRVVTPESLAGQAMSLPAESPFACLAVLRDIAPAMDSLGLAWGPTGSVGFALATGRPVLHAESDLDLLVRMPVLPSATQCERLAAWVAGAACRIDVQVDTGHGGFALLDWLASPGKVLLKTDHGPRLVVDPWDDFAGTT